MRETMSRTIRRTTAEAQFGLYVMGVGIVAVAAFIVGKPELRGYSRYVLLGLLVPIGLTASLLQLERQATLKRLAAGVVIAWTALMMVEHVSVLGSFARHPPANPVRLMADHLIQQEITSAEAGYWQAYVVSFVAQERVRVASSDVVRIQEYQDLFGRSRRSVRLNEEACPGGQRVGRWYVCTP